MNMAPPSLLPHSNLLMAAKEREREPDSERALSLHMAAAAAAFCGLRRFLALKRARASDEVSVVIVAFARPAFARPSPRFEISSHRSLLQSGSIDGRVSDSVVCDARARGFDVIVELVALMMMTMMPSVLIDSATPPTWQRRPFIVG